jgi:C4-dicarboxylate transporter
MMKKPNLQFLKKLKLRKRYRQLNKSKFMGQQFSRLKMGQTYYSIIVSTMSAISLLTIAFHLNLWHLIIIFPFILLATFLIGLFLDKKNINLEDYRKSIEMHARKLNLEDIKQQEFQLMQTIFIIKALRENIDEEDLISEYRKYKDKWS